MAGLGDIITAGGPLIPAGRDELGRPLFKDMAGNLVYKGLPKAPPAATYGPVQGPNLPEPTRPTTPRGRPRPTVTERENDPLLSLGKMLAEGAWQGVSAPGRALKGEPVTLGDVWATALDYGGVSNVATAPAGAIRNGTIRTQFADPDDFTPEIVSELRRTETGATNSLGNRQTLNDVPGAAWVTADEVVPPPRPTYTPDPNQIEMDLPGGSYTPPMSPAERARAAVPDDPDLASVMSEGSLRYSPSRLASKKLKTKKGTYEQFRAELLKNGAKPDELTWSGFDEQFKGKKGLTQQEIQDFLDKNTDLVRPETTRAQGRLGADTDDFDIDRLRDEYAEDMLDNEIEYYRDEYVPEMLENEVRYLKDLDEDELRRVFDDNVGGDDVEFTYWKSQMADGVLTDDYNVFPSLDEYVDDYVANNSEHIENMARQSANELAYNADDDEILAAMRPGQDLGDVFDPGDTQYSNYFVGDVTDYQERTLHSGARGRPYDGANAHFRDSPILHTRSGVAEGPDGRTLVAGEFQSDWAQRGRSETKGNKRFSTPEEEMANAPVDMLDGLTRETPRQQLTSMNENARRVLRDAWYDDEIDMRPSLRFSDDYIYPGDTRSMIRGAAPEDTPRFVLERALDNYSPMTSQPSIGPEVQYRWDFTAEQPFNPFPGRPQPVPVVTDYVGGVPADYRNHVRVDTSVNAPDAFPGARYLWENRPMPEGPEYLPGFQDGPVQAVARKFYDENPPLDELIAKAAETEDFYQGTIPSAPHVGGSTDKWSLAAFRDTLDDAIQRGDIDRIAFGSPDMASDMTMGTSGVGSYYSDILPKVIDKELRKTYGKEFRLNPYNLNVTSSNRPTTYQVPSLELTPEFIEQVKRKGIPLFAGSGLALSLPELMAYDQAEPQL